MLVLPPLLGSTAMPPKPTTKSPAFLPRGASCAAAPVTTMAARATAPASLPKMLRMSLDPLRAALPLRTGIGADSYRNLDPDQVSTETNPVRHHIVAKKP